MRKGFFVLVAKAGGRAGLGVPGFGDGLRGVEGVLGGGTGREAVRERDSECRDQETLRV